MKTPTLWKTNALLEALRLPLPSRPETGEQDMESVGRSPGRRPQRRNEYLRGVSDNILPVSVMAPPRPRPPSRRCRALAVSHIISQIKPRRRRRRQRRRPSPFSFIARSTFAEGPVQRSPSLHCCYCHHQPFPSLHCSRLCRRPPVFRPSVCKSASVYLSVLHPFCCLFEGQTTDDRASERVSERCAHSSFVAP